MGSMPGRSTFASRLPLWVSLSPYTEIGICVALLFTASAGFTKSKSLGVAGQLVTLVCQRVPRSAAFQISHVSKSAKTQRPQSSNATPDIAGGLNMTMRE